MVDGDAAVAELVDDEADAADLAARTPTGRHEAGPVGGVATVASARHRRER